MTFTPDTKKWLALTGRGIAIALMIIASISYSIEYVY